MLRHTYWAPLNPVTEGLHAVELTLLLWCMPEGVAKHSLDCICSPSPNLVVTWPCILSPYPVLPISACRRYGYQRWIANPHPWCNLFKSRHTQSPFWCSAGLVPMYSLSCMYSHAHVLPLVPRYSLSCSATIETQTDGRIGSLTSLPVH